MDIDKEKELVRKAQKNSEVFGQLYDEYYPKIFGYVLKRVANLTITQDVVSETFYKALKNLWQFQWRNISFGAWLYRIANNEIANYYRKNKNYSISLDKLLEEQGLELIASHNPEIDFLEAEEKLKNYQDFLKIQKKISQLSIKYQEVITLRFFETKKIKEIAEILGKKEGTIKSLLHRGIEKLKELME